MKKFYLLIILCACASITFAQLKVASSGKVGIGTSSPLAKLDVNQVSA
jgi:hypothetical protein